MRRLMRGEILFSSESRTSYVKVIDPWFDRDGDVCCSLFRPDDSEEVLYVSETDFSKLLTLNQIINNEK